MTTELPTPGAVPWGTVGKVAAALCAGLLVGFVGVSRGCDVYAQGPAVSQERYALVAGNLYAQGESLVTIRELLLPLGVADQASFMLQMSDRLSKSGDRLKQRQAEELRLLGLALRQNPSDTEVPGKVVEPGTAAGSSAQDAPGPSTQATAVKPAMAVVRGDGVRLRAEPGTKAAAIALLKNGDKVEVLNVVEGDQIENNERRWYKVRSGSTVGFVYFTLLVPAD